MLVTTTCLAKCFRGGSFSGVLWMVWERTFAIDGEEARPTERQGRQRDRRASAGLREDRRGR